MDFDAAARRLKKDQSRIKSRSRGFAVSEKAKREAEYRRRQQERLQQERKHQAAKLAYQKHYLADCERKLGVRSLAQDGGLRLEATSIHGDGDKIALPPSVLQRLTDGGQIMDGSSPWMFRISLPNSEYQFPASNQVKALLPPDEDAMVDDSDEDQEEEITTREAYLEELKHRYLTYSHGTVVEFTQEEGFVGLPAPIAKALLASANEPIRTKRTKDPATPAEDNMQVEEDDEKTPGHLAWGAFDVPAIPVEISLVKLPKGRSCTLVPTKEAIMNGFYSLKDVKLVLEQSLVRTRSTLSVGDTVHTWHRGVRYDMVVEKLSPAQYGAVSIINTDIEVDFAPNKEMEDRSLEADEAAPEPASETAQNAGQSLGTGHRLSDSSPDRAAVTTAPQVIQEDVDLRPEPPADQTDGVCTVQIRGDGATGRRRLDVKMATVSDLYAFASSIRKEPNGENFRLVTRLPRRVVDLSDVTLAEAGIGAGQELFMIENI